jgi:hypothetical protein
VNLSELRDALHEEANRFSLDGELPPGIKRRTFRRAALSVAGTGTFVVVLVSAGALALWRSPALDDGGRAPVAVPVNFADYYDDVHHEGDSDAGRQISGDDVREHIECMREQGFELPDPTRTDEGWAVLVDDPEDMGMETRRWREAAFVTCRPSPPPGAGDLIFSNDILPTERVDEFRACMSNEGFDLPGPRLTDGNVWRFPISEAGIDIGRDDWNRAVFVTCAPQ